MAVNTQSELKVGDLVTHTGRRGFFDISKEYKGIGIVMSNLYKKSERQYVHDVWFAHINQIQQIGRGALEKLKEDTHEMEQTK